MASRIHSLLPRVALWSSFLIPVAIYVAYRSYTGVFEVPRGSDIFAVVQGSWAWSPADSGCRDNPHRIAVSTDHRTMTITAAHPYKHGDGSLDSIVHYEILQATRSSIRGVIRGETRLTRDSQPVVWDLVLKSPDSYTWHRTDWLSWQHTRLIRRCPAHRTEAP